MKEEELDVWVDGFSLSEYLPGLVIGVNVLPRLCHCGEIF
jgi:hypothetical protein